MDLCFPEISVAWTQKCQMWRGELGRWGGGGKFWRFSFLTQRFYTPTDGCTSWPRLTKGSWQDVVCCLQSIQWQTLLCLRWVHICMSLKLWLGGWTCWVGPTLLDRLDSKQNASQGRTFFTQMWLMMALSFAADFINYYTIAWYFCISTCWNKIDCSKQHNSCGDISAVQLCKSEMYICASRTPFCMTSVTADCVEK